MIVISRLTREYLFWGVETPDDLSTSTAHVAFMPNPEDIPEELDWHTANLVQSHPGGDSPWAVRILIGPDHASATPLNAGTDYQAWVRITDDPERPVRKISTIVVE
jgi:hypothetical protein